MANVIREVGKDGIVRERDPEVDAKVERFRVSDRIQRSLGYHLDSRHASTIGAGKKTGNMSHAMAAREYKGTVTNKEARKRRRRREANFLARQDRNGKAA